MKSYTFTVPALSLVGLLSTAGLIHALPATSSPTGGLAGTAAAVAAAAARRDDVSPPTDQEFSLAMKVDDTYVSLTATYNGTNDIVLKAGQMSVYPGTPTYTNQSSTVSTSGYNTSLVFDLMDSTSEGISAGLYGLSVPDLGEVYGASANVFAVADYQEFEFDVVDGAVYHQLTAAPQNWFACNDTTVDGEVNYFLKWGVYNENLTPPSGCAFTTVIQNFNVPGGATS